MIIFSTFSLQIHHQRPRKPPYTRVDFYISGIEKKTKIKHQKWLHCFSKYSPWRSIDFLMRLNQFSNNFFHSDWGISKTCILNALTASSGVEKRWLHNLFLMCRKKKKSLGAKSGLYAGWPINSMFSVLKKSLVWADVWKIAFSWWRMIRLRRLLSHIFPKTSGKQIVVYHSEFIVRRCTNGTVATCPVFLKKQATIYFEVLRARTTFVGFCSSWKAHTVDWSLLSSSYA